MDACTQTDFESVAPAEVPFSEEWGINSTEWNGTFIVFKCYDAEEDGKTNEKASQVVACPEMWSLVENYCAKAVEALNNQ